VKRISIYVPICTNTPEYLSTDKQTPNAFNVSVSINLCCVLVTKEVSQTLGAGFKNLGNSAIQILEGVDVAAEQALGTGARIVTGIAETAAETAETGARKAIVIANVSFFFITPPLATLLLDMLSVSCNNCSDVVHEIY